MIPRIKFLIHFLFYSLRHDSPQQVLLRTITTFFAAKQNLNNFSPFHWIQLDRSGRAHSFPRRHRIVFSYMPSPAQSLHVMNSNRKIYARFLLWASANTTNTLRRYSCWRVSWKYSTHPHILCMVGWWCVMISRAVPNDAEIKVKFNVIFHSFCSVGWPPIASAYGRLFHCWCVLWVFVVGGGGSMFEWSMVAEIKLANSRARSVCFNIVGGGIPHNISS